VTALLLAALTGLVLQEDVALRAAPRDAAPSLSTLSQGNVLEIRGERPGYLQVYDHRRERGGYVRAASVRRYEGRPEEAESLLAVSEYLRDSPGFEALGIAHLALFLKVAAPAQINAAVFDALGTMADRLARRASARSSRPGDSVAKQLDVVGGYGLAFRSFDVGGRSVVCYDGEAFRRVLALEATVDQKGRALLGLTRPDCVDPAASPVDRRALDEWRASVLEQIDPSTVPAELAARLHARRAGIWAAVTYERARQEGQPGMRTAAERALKELALIDRAALAEEDARQVDDAAVRVGASRWAAEDGRPPEGLYVTTVAGPDGSNCVELHTKGADAPLLSRCTYGVVWAASARASRQGTALALAVQPTAAWRELWLFHKTDAGWVADVLTPGTEGPDVGYLEYAGWSPDGTQLLAVREAKEKGSFRKSFEIINVATIEVEKRADKPTSLTPFHRWQAPDWRAQTIALR
jgi:hypothetical protein